MVITFEGDDNVYIIHSTPNPGSLVARGEEGTRQGVIITNLADELASGIYTAAARRTLKPQSAEAMAKWRAFALRMFEKQIPYESSKKDVCTQHVVDWLTVIPSWPCRASIAARAVTTRRT